MQKSVAEFKKIYERDMDLLIIEEFIANRNFARIFLDKAQLPDDYVICKAVPSLADADGESDITLILQYPRQKSYFVDRRQNRCSDDAGAKRTLS